MSLLLAVAVLSIFGGCAHSLEAASLPVAQVRAETLLLELQDPRKHVTKASLAPTQMEHGETVVAPRAIPADALFQVQQRLNQVLLKEGPKLTVEAGVKQVDVTFRHNGRDTFARFDVVLKIRVLAPSGGLVLKGTVAAFNEMDARQASLEEQERFLHATLLQAFDKMFADEAVLERLNRELEKLKS